MDNPTGSVASKFIPSSMASTKFLSSLISAGPDNQKNLYRARLSYIHLDASSTLRQNFEVRLESFDIPNFGASTVDLPYLNTSLLKVVPSSTISRNLKLQFRLDGALALYSTLITSLSVNSLGTWTVDSKGDKDKVWNAEIFPLNPKNNVEEYIDQHRWIFSDCHLTEVPSISYGYNQSGATVITCNFTFRQMIFE